MNGRRGAGICRDRRRHYLGLCPTEVEAAVAYNRADRLLFGEFARVDIIADDEALPPARWVAIEHEVERGLDRAGRTA